MGEINDMLSAYKILELVRPGATRALLGRDYVRESRSRCEMVGVSPDAPPPERREAILTWLREALSLPEDATPWQIDSACNGREHERVFTDLLQLAVCPNEIRAEDVGRVFPIDGNDAVPSAGVEPVVMPEPETIDAPIEEVEADPQPDAVEDSPVDRVLRAIKAGRTPERGDVAQLTREERDRVAAATGFVPKSDWSIGDPLGPYSKRQGWPNGKDF